MCEEITKSSRDDSGNCSDIEQYPKDPALSTQDGSISKYTLVVCKIRRSKDMPQEMVTHSITIESPFLKKAFREHIFNDYSAFANELSNMEFKAPFWPFVHRWGDLLALKRRHNTDKITNLHCSQLQDILKCEISDKIQAFSDHILKKINNFQVFVDDIPARRRCRIPS